MCHPEYIECIHIIELQGNLHIHLYNPSIFTTHKQTQKKAAVQTDWRYQQCLTGKDMHVGLIKG